MKRIVKNARHHLSVVRSTATRRVIKQFADRTGLVYFGHVSSNGDEHKMVHGVTLGKGHVDRHYTIGTFQSYDSILLQRTQELSFPNAQPQKYTWTILQMYLHKDVKKLPHVFVGWRSFGNMFYANLPMKIPRLKIVNLKVLNSYSPEAETNLIAYAPDGNSEVFYNLLPPEAIGIFVERFRDFGIEIRDEKIYIYACNSITSRRLLDSMFQAGIWLADYLSQNQETEE